MKHFFLPFALVLLCLPAGAQKAKWFVNKDLFNFENIDKTTYVTSNTSPFIVNHMEVIFPGVPNGPVINPDEYLITYDTSGTELWRKKLVNIINGAAYPTILNTILTKSNDTFWTVIGPAFDTIKIGSQQLISLYNDSTYLSYYFVEMDRNGLVQNYFTHAHNMDIDFMINDVVFDGNGNFILAGSTKPNVNNLLVWTNQPFSFGTYTASLAPTVQKNFIAKLYANGTEGNFFQFNGHHPYPWIIKDISYIQKLQVNKTNGNILFLGSLGDTLSIGSNTMINTTPICQLFLGRIDSSFNLLGSKMEEVSTLDPYGTQIQSLKFDSYTNTFYFTGTFEGSLMYMLSQPNPPLPWLVAAGPSIHAYVAKLQPNSLNLDTVIAVVPALNINQPSSICTDLKFSKDGDLFLCGFTDDSLMKFGSHVFNPNNATFNRLPFFAKMTPASFKVDTALFAYSAMGIGSFDQMDIGDNHVYLGGFMNGSFLLDVISATSNFQKDGCLARIDVNALAHAHIKTSNATICKNGVLTATNSSWGQPSPAFSWSATPSQGVVFTPGSTAANPVISFNYPGLYTITCVASNSLGSTSDNAQVFVSLCTGIDGPAVPGLVMLLPNPSSGYLSLLNPSGASEQVEVTVMNALGQPVLHRTVILTKDQPVELDLTQQSNGLYLVTLKNAQRQVTRKVLLSK
jgi:hypothetical protein